MAQLDQYVIVDGVVYRPGDTPPPEVADKIRNPDAWVGDVAPPLSNGGPWAGATAPTPEQFGAVGDGVTDDTTALAAWLASGNVGLGLRAGRTYLTTAPLIHPPTLLVVEGHGATIKATAAGSYIWNRTSTAQVSGLRITDLRLDCNNLMDGMKLRGVSRGDINGLRVFNSVGHGLCLGESGTPRCNGMRINEFKAEFSTQPVGSIGLGLYQANDTFVVGAEIVGPETGVKVGADAFDSVLINAHVWGGFVSSLVNTCFDLSAGTTLIRPYADTPTTYGFRLRSSDAPFRIVLPEVYLNPTVSNDNVAVGIHLDDYVGVKITDASFAGGDATHRLAADIEGPLEFVQSSPNTYYYQTVIQRLVPTPLRRTWQPEYSGFKGWTFDPAGSANAGAIPAQGTMQIIRLPWQPGEKVTTIYTSVVTAGSGLVTGQCLLGVYDMSGNLLGTTQNAANTWQSTGLRTHVMNTPARCNDPYIDVAFYWNGTTGPTLLRGSNAGIGGGPRYATADAGLTTALPPTMGARATAFNSWWVAVA